MQHVSYNYYDFIIPPHPPTPPPPPKKEQSRIYEITFIPFTCNELEVLHMYRIHVSYRKC